jgi:D-lactate dehydrogenase (cytochrome)
MSKAPSNDFVPFLARAEAAFPGRCSTGEAVCRQHSNSLTYVSSMPPQAVVWPETTEEVATLVRLASVHRVPLIGFGAGTSLEGHVNAPRGGVAVDFSRMNSVLEVRSDDLDCTVEAGVTLQQLRQELRATGLFFPVDPGADSATLGGMAATRASGTTTLKYGSMRDNVVSLTAVMASGEIIRTAHRARKSSSGYDLTRLLIGSEGTLGLITGLTLKLYGVPETTLAASATFGTIDAACRASTLAIQSGLCLARVEVLDDVQMQCVNAYSGLNHATSPTLFLEFHGSAAACASDYANFKDIALGEGARGITSATEDADRKRLWQARHDAFWSVKAAWPGREVLVTDVAVPLSKLARAVTETAADIKSSGLTAPIVGHVGDGNFHAIVVVNPSDTSEMARVEAFLERLAARALGFDGTVTGEHGIGQGKRRFMVSEHGAALDVMRAIKRALDPLEIFNPDKMF